MKSTGNRGVVQSRLQVLHVHVFLVAPLGARYMAKAGTDQHQGGVAVRERPYHSRPSADLTVQPLDHVVGTDARPMLAGEVTVGQCLLNAVLDLLGGLLQLHGAQLGDHGFRLLAGRLLALLRMDCLEHFRHNFDLGFGHNRENVAVEMHRAALDTCDEYLTLAEEGDPVRKNPLPMYLIVVAASCAISGFICIMLKWKMQTVHKKVEANEYVAAGGLTLTKQYDRYTHTTETRRKIRDDSDSGSTSSCSGGGGSGRSGKF